MSFALSTTYHFSSKTLSLSLSLPQNSSIQFALPSDRRMQTVCTQDREAKNFHHLRRSLLQLRKQLLVGQDYRRRSKWLPSLTRRLSARINQQHAERGWVPVTSLREQSACWTISTGCSRWHHKTCTSQLPSSAPQHRSNVTQLLWRPPWLPRSHRRHFAWPRVSAELTCQNGQKSEEIPDPITKPSCVRLGKTFLRC